MTTFRAVICGGGIAAIEGLLRLRRLAGPDVEIDVVAPNDALVYRPLAVREPFAAGPPPRFGLERITADAGARWVRDGLNRVDRDARVVHTRGGQALDYDALLIAVGARSVATYHHVQTFSDAEAGQTYQGLIQDIEEGYSRKIAFLQPEGPVWPLPLYELALMTAERADSMGIDDLELSIVTPEPSPLAIFGRAASDALTAVLERAGITAYCSAIAHVPGNRRLVIQPQGVELHPERMVAMPRVEGPAIRGLAGADADGFVPIDVACRVPGTDGRVLAAGDAAAFPIKHGGLGAQMADTAAAAIAELAGAAAEPKPFRPVIQGALLTGGSALYVQARIVGARGFESQVFETPPWPAGQKIVAEELGAYLAEREGDRSHVGGSVG